MRGKRFVLLAALLIPAAVLAVVFFMQMKEAKEILSAERRKQRQRETVSFQTRNLSLAPNPDAALFLGPPQIRDLSEFQGRIYAATSGGLIVYSQEGKKLEHWTTLEGLPSLDLTSLAVQDASLWVGTKDSGVLRFRENSWQHFQPREKKLRSVTAMLAVKQGALYIGTTGGLIRYAEQSFEPLFQEHLKSNAITRLAGDSHRLFIGTFQMGLYVYEKGVLQQYDKEKGINDQLITDIVPTENGCYVSTPAGIQSFEDGRFDNVAQNLFVTSFLLDPPAIWAATYDRGIIRLDRRIGVETRPDSPALLRRVGGRLMALDHEGARYLGDNRRWEKWGETQRALADSNISSLLKTREGNLWVGYFDKGMDVLSQELKPLSHREDDTFFCINHLAQDSNGAVYVSTANGLAIVSPDQSVNVYRESDGLLSDRVMQAFPLDSEGKKVAVATAQGFTLKEGASMKSIYAFHGLVNNHVYTMARSGDQLYLGTLGGISAVSRMQVVDNWTQMDSGLKRNWVNALMAVNNRLFVGTYGSGIQARTASGEWIDFDPLPKDFEVNPNALFYDGKFLFCGTLDRGFYVYDTRSDSWKQFRHNLPSMNVTAFAADSQYLYIGTDRGLLQLKYDKLSTIPDLR